MSKWIKGALELIQIKEKGHIPPPKKRLMNQYKEPSTLSTTKTVNLLGRSNSSCRTLNIDIKLRVHQMGKIYALFSVNQVLSEYQPRNTGKASSDAM